MALYNFRKISVPSLIIFTGIQLLGKLFFYPDYESLLKLSFLAKISTTIFEG